ncbi:MAG TPA: hypothetical protein DDY14_03215 [Chromatiaceae bacterium]|jgi:hypothetical protein|nr:MAG: hypothetical protein N838_04370 [Thiohalocapsa sp. PB-PSB1]QQO55556.1 MAG: hypothetical protein N838_21630 [Thiohalocapsa sp. PB-PSB1]HBG94339.1 hypothetical protein [Chromatiaceae bacterium]HCS90485.1 hypothetical protein [Chromatiaceae bacterium]
MTDKPNLQRFELADGEQVWIETTDIRISGAGHAEFDFASRGNERRAEMIRAGIAQVRPAANAVFEALKGFNTPKQIQMEVGIGFSVQIGAFLTSTDSNANIKLKLVWENPSILAADEEPADPSG